MRSGLDVDGLPADQLQRVADAVTDLLSRVDRALACYGTPPDHPVLDGLRAFRALPGELATAIVALDPAPLWHRAQRLAGLRDSLTAQGTAVRLTGERMAWTGPGADTFRQQLAAVAGQLSGPDVSMMDTVAGTARHGMRLARWWSALRAALVEFFVRHATTTAAATVQAARFDTSDPDELRRFAMMARAAADLAAGCFAALRPVLAQGDELCGDGGVPGVPLPDPLPLAPPGASAGTGAGGFEVLRE